MDVIQTHSISASMHLGPEKIKSSIPVFILSHVHNTVRDVTWMSDQSVHLAEWMAALEVEQVTVRHLAKCPRQSAKDMS